MPQQMTFLYSKPMIVQYQKGVPRGASVCREACRDTGNLNRLPSPFVRDPYSLSGGHEFTFIEKVHILIPATPDLIFIVRYLRKDVEINIVPNKSKSTRT